MSLAAGDSSALVLASSGKDKQFAVDHDVRAMCVSGHSVWLAHADGKISVRKTRTAEVAATLAPYRGRAWCLLALSAGSADLMWVGLSNGDIEVYDAHTRAPLSLLSRHTGGVYCLAEFSGSVFSGSSDFEIMQWDAARRVFLRQLSGHTNYVRALHADGALLFSASNDHTVRVWNVPTGALVATGRFHGDGVGCLCRVGAHMWSGDDAGTVCVWAIDGLALVHKAAEHTGRVNVLRHVGARVYSGGGDCEVLIWDCATRAVVSRIADHRGWLHAIACPAQLARYFVWSAAADGTVRCWHHDEYRVMTADMERFDDLHWYHQQRTPLKELNAALSEELTRTRDALSALQQAYNKDVGGLRAEVERTKEAIHRVTVLEGSLGSVHDRVADREREVQGLRDIVAGKDVEMTSIQANCVRFAKENSELRMEVERLRSQNTDALRRADLHVAEKEIADAALQKMLEENRAEDGGRTVAPPIIIRDASEASAAAAKLYKDLQDCMALNNSFREEVTRYKAMLGITAATARPGAPAAPAGPAGGKQRPATASAATHSLSQHHRLGGPSGVADNLDAGEAALGAVGSGAVDVGAGYHWRGSHFGTAVGDLIADRYYSDRVLFHDGRSQQRMSRAPRVPPTASASCKCSGAAKRFKH